MSEGGERAHWVQNIIRSNKVSFSVGSQNFDGTGKVIADDDPLALEIKKLMKGKYGWDSGLIVELMAG